MSLSRSWQFIGGVDGPWYRFFDWLRRRLNVRLVRFMIGRLAGKRECLVLEAGSGTAFASSILQTQSEVHRAVCMDMDADALRLAIDRDATLLAVVGDLSCMPFRDGVFDLVFNSSTVEHLDDPGVAVGEMQRVCARDGYVFVGVPYAWGPLAFQPLIARSKVGVWLGTVFGREGLNRMLREGGLSPVAHWRYFWNFFIGAIARPTNTPRSGAES